MESSNEPTPIAPAVFHDARLLPDRANYRGPASDAGFSEATWNAAIRLYLSHVESPALN